MLRPFTIAALLWTCAWPVLAQERALVLDSADADGVRAAQAGDALIREGVRTEIVEDATRETMIASLRRFADAADQADGLAVLLAGRFLQVGGATYFVAPDTDGEDPVDVVANGIPVSLVLEVLTATPTRAVLGLAHERGAQGSVAAGVTEGVGPLEIPQGVTVIEGMTDEVSRIWADTLAVTGASLPRRVTSTRDARIMGFVVPGLSFRPAEEAQTSRPAPPPQPQSPPKPPEPRAPDTAQADAEAALWRLITERDRADGYQVYLDRFPDGPNAKEARARLQSLQSTGSSAAERREEALGLGREERRGIQRDLKLLGYDTRGVDGIFGPGSRSAIAQWQRDRGLSDTGFLARDQIARLDRDAAQARAEEARRAAAFWEDIGGIDAPEAALVRYLDRFPAGENAARARAQITRLRDAREQASGASERERQLWRAVTDENSVGSYQNYLRAFPDGQFSAAARDAIERLREAPAQPQQPTQGGGAGTVSPAEEQARAAEEALGLTREMRLAVEQRLAALKLGPGAVDGTFDSQSRDALRRFQNQSGLPVTGYMNQTTAVRLLADALRSVLD